MVSALSAAAALLLLVSGVAKLRSPAAAAGMIVELFGRPAGDRRRLAPLVRVGGGGEVVVGALFLATGTRPVAVLLASCYLVFGVVAALLLGRGTTAARTSCGCFGATDSPVGRGHLVLDVVALGAAIAAVVRPPGAGAALFDGATTTVLTALLQALLLAALGYLSITSLPALAALVTPSGDHRTFAAVPRTRSSEEDR